MRFVVIPRTPVDDWKPKVMQVCERSTNILERLASGCQTNFFPASGHDIPVSVRRRFPLKSSTNEKAIMEWNNEKVQVNIRHADTEDLLDRITAYRLGMEPDAIQMTAQELRERDVTAAEIAEHREA